MKNFLILFGFAIFYCGYGQFDGTMKVVKTSSEIGFLFQETDGVFKEVFTFQFESDGGKLIRPTLETVKYKRYNFELDKKSLIIYYDEDNYEIYTISDKKEGENVFRGYGLSHKSGAFVLDAIGEQHTSIFDLIVSKDQPNASVNSSGCASGGRGSTSCSSVVSETVADTSLTISCDVSCGGGYYACCNLGSCKCIENPPTPKATEIALNESTDMKYDNLKIRLVENPITHSVDFAFYEKHQTEKMSDYKIEIFDHMGSSVYKNQLSPSVDFTQQRPGFYIFVITDGKDYIQKGKLIKN